MNRDCEGYCPACGAAVQWVMRYACSEPSGVPVPLPGLDGRQRYRSELRFGLDCRCEACGAELVVEGEGVANLYRFKGLAGKES